MLKKLKMTIAEYQGKRPSLEDTHLVTPLKHWHEQTSEQKENAGYMCLKALQEDREKSLPGDYSGNTAVGYVISNTRVYPMNIGDSALFSIILSKDHELLHFQRINHLHTATDPDEIKRILKIPNAEIYDDRVGGILAVSRHIGSHEMQTTPYGRPSVIPGVGFTPEIINSFQLPKLKKGDRHFLLLACDGLTEPDEIKDELEGASEKRYTLLKAWLTKTIDADELAQKALEAGSMDNITVIVLETNDFKAQDDDWMVVLFDGHGGPGSAIWCREHIKSVMENNCKELSKRLKCTR